MAKFFKGKWKWVLLMCFALVALTSVALREDDKLDSNYQQWSNMSIDALNKTARNYLNNGQPDSAYVCYSILAGQDPDNEKNLHTVCHAKTCLGILLYECFFDYKKASTFLIDAEDFANKHHISQELPYIYLTRANITFDSNSINNDFAYNAKMLAEQQKAFLEAVKANNLHIATIAFNNLAYISLKYNDISIVVKDVDIMKKAISDYPSGKKVTDVSSPYYVPDSIIMKDYAHTLANGISFYCKGDFAHALELFNQLPGKIIKKSALARARFMGSIGVMQYATLLQMHKDAEALQELDMLETLSSQAGLESSYLETCWMKMQYYADHHNQALKQQYELLYYKKKDTYTRNSNLMMTQQAELEFELQQVVFKMNEQKQNAQFLQKMVIGISLFAIVLVVLLLMLFKKNRDLKEKNLQLFQKTQDMLKEEKVKKASQDANEAPEKYRTNSLGESARDALMAKIYEVMENSEQIFESGFTQVQLAELVGSNTNDVSRAINEVTKHNFSELLGEYRIKEACRRLNDTEHYGNITMEGLATSVGIKSRSNFTTLFKKFTGLTPSTYQQLLRENDV